ncbi:hypothetical protein [Algoriphagus persicinus]|uniref:hypothetical protein n=1 Tax=Algoriphagus persicinus TaxID=3108754 RepID=UPI002B3C42F4|nr:hypothetical protein [Algoriphagus sp. E1-3-M2]MEB2787079.1 hypothetical protein [Algoriphagus sp. E1-3-M2]
MKSSMTQVSHRGMIISQHTPQQQICLFLGRVRLSQQRARRLACGVKLCWRLDFLVLLRQGKRTKEIEHDPSDT